MGMAVTEVAVKASHRSWDFMDLMIGEGRFRKDESGQIKRGSLLYSLESGRTRMKRKVEERNCLIHIQPPSSKMHCLPADCRSLGDTKCTCVA